MEYEEEKYERHLCQEIMKLKKTHFDLKNILVLAVVFFVFGYLIQAMEGSDVERKREGKRRKMQKSKPRRSK